jgi:hypothetical protein
LLFWDNVEIGEWAGTPPSMLRRAKRATDEHGHREAAAA